MEIDHGILSTFTLLLPLVQEGLVSVKSKRLCGKYWLTAQAKSVNGLTDRVNMTVQWSLNLMLHKVLNVLHIMMKLIL